MRTLILNKFLHRNGGSETYIFKLGEALEQHGHEVQYFGMEHEGRCVGNRVNAYTSDMDFHGGSKLSKLTYPIKTIYSKEARVQLRKVLDDFKPDVCHLNNFNYQLTPSIILEIVKWRKETGRDCKIIFTAHDYQLVCPNHMLNNPNTHQNCEKCLGGHFVNCMKGKCIHGSTAKSAIGMMEAEFWKWKGTYKYIDTMICCSEFMKTKMDSNPLFATKTVAMHNFIDKVEWKETEKKDYVLYFGRFSEEKGIGTLIKVCNELPDVQFIFAGTGPLEETVNGIKNIKNVGFQKGEALEKLIREARFSIYPSEWYENCPFSVMESQMYGTPVLGANIGGIPELIQVGKTGELFESGNAEDLKKKIEKLWGDKKLCEAYLVYASSSSVYGSNKKVPYSTDDKVDNPVSLYAATKKSNELMAHAYSKLYNIPSTGLRFFTVYGPAGRPDMAYFGFTNKLVKGETIKIFNYGNCKRDFTYVDDIVEGVVRVMKKAPDKKNGEDGLPIPPYAVYNIGNQNPENLLDFVQILSEELVRAKVLPEDYDFEAHKELVPMQPGDVPVTYADTSALERDFGYKPSTSLQTGLRKFAEWYAEFYK